MTSIERVTCGIDWLSATLPGGSDNEQQWLRTCEQAIETIAKEGYPLIARGLLGYRGISAGNCFAGARDDSTFVQLTGHNAHRWFPHLWRADLHISRIDIQVTVQFETEQLLIAKKGYAYANISNHALPEGRRRKLYIISGSDGGDTLYIGAPSSDQRGRLYNKARQSGERNFDRCWRYEILYRNDLAGQCAAQLADNTVSQEQRILALVCVWYAARGIDCGFLHNSRELVLPKARTLPTDIERKLEWLRRQVRPTIRYLQSVGYGDIVLSILTGVEDGTTQPTDDP